MYSVLVAQLWPTLGDPMGCSPPGSSVHGIFKARILELDAIPFSRGSSWCRDWTRVSSIADRFFTTWATREASLKLLRMAFCTPFPLLPFLGQISLLLYILMWFQVILSTWLCHLDGPPQLTVPSYAGSLDFNITLFIECLRGWGQRPRFLSYRPISGFSILSARSLRTMIC